VCTNLARRFCPIEPCGVCSIQRQVSVADVRATAVAEIIEDAGVATAVRGSGVRRRARLILGDGTVGLVASGSPTWAQFRWICAVWVDVCKVVVVRVAAEVGVKASRRWRVVALKEALMPA
jgi:hypothetical protein